MSGYFLYHSIGTFPGKAERMAAALADFSGIWSAEDDGQWPAALAARQRFIDAWIRLIEAPHGTLTTAENVTAALYSLIGALPSERLAGKRLLVAADCFPSLHFLLAGLAQRFNFTLDTVPLRPGESWVRDEDFVARWQEDVGLALITFVTSTASHRCDVAKLAAHGRAMGSIVGVDITQGVGVVPFSVAATPVDFVVSTSLKWLCGASGAGILQVAPDLLSTCRPELRGWFSQPNPFSWDLDAFSYASDARRFDHGTPAILASVASLPGLQWLEGTGIDAIRAQNAAHVGRIIDAAMSNGWTIRSPLDAEKRGGSVMIGLPQGVETAKLVAKLRDEQLYCDARGTTLRLSPGMVTTSAAVDALIARLRELIGSRQRLAS
ncbi:aminotransferase class V-fold PLP-dependent enzyme [Mesorhizobium sp. M4B.F.Ca.ET.215.01.1.1]|uniref:aminotransferase class V-fold PLP-dependent enzyme n=1 Tax=unclassified Mesorhizobium TaxID=325217 RepID=UPI000FC9B068|nr:MULTISPECIES: aminotransferase class V-fold PLP-dependent enzyme [unclassified Mesorhizobium]RUW18399.1 aminotransferase class V-fold PLP-dependent enzyme [Mesorhizobium sp. M4B.F.Ca.ET.013.02.1.1]RVD44097.1 aminotransferase class V-fold PLP-dependent enzyme [Mesorhizobium sp. M4B.F.Ca.ET.019.03.1.1]TGQ15268.1 aminotransferase class V-fold PLP-dependent enzyme [Mesorhizobium sp. M4B.F.Ca.ET.215.01.1.1]TGQ48524.1 aminotransferase class V-fold PLP-dependent enzyme [Mesorhizobium sp. M00.F.Ca.E